MKRIWINMPEEPTQEMLEFAAGDRPEMQLVAKAMYLSMVEYVRKNRI